MLVLTIALLSTHLDNPCNSQMLFHTYVRALIFNLSLMFSTAPSIADVQINGSFHDGANLTIDGANFIPGFFFLDELPETTVVLGNLNGSYSNCENITWDSSDLVNCITLPGNYLNLTITVNRQPSNVWIFNISSKIPLFILC